MHLFYRGTPKPSLLTKAAQSNIEVNSFSREDELFYNSPPSTIKSFFIMPHSTTNLFFPKDIYESEIQVHELLYSIIAAYAKCIVQKFSLISLAENPYSLNG